MSDLSNKVISTNFQKLLQISESGVIANSTGSAYALRLSGSSNVAIGAEPLDGVDLYVQGTISSSIISASTGVFGANTVIIGDSTISQPSGEGLTFRDSASNELGAFQGDGYFILSSSLETGGPSRPLFNLTQQVGSTQHKNVMQIDLYSFKHYQNSTTHQWRFGVQPSGSSQQGDFFINGQNGAFTVNPSPTGLNKPSFYVTQSNLRIGLGMYPNNTDKVSVDGSIFASGSDVGHITASGNLLVEGDAVIKGNLTFGDSTSDNISFGAEVSSSILPDSDGTFTLGNSSKRWKEVHADLVQVQGNVSGSGNLTIHGNADLRGDVTLGDSTFDDVVFNAEVSSSIIPNTDGDFNLGSVSKRWKEVHADLVQVQGNVSGSGNLTVAGDINANGNIVGDNLTSISGIQHITASGDIDLNGSLDVNGTTNLDTVDIDRPVDMAASLVVGSSITGHITASGNISSSGNVIAKEVEVETIKGSLPNGTEVFKLDSNSTFGGTLALDDTSGTAYVAITDNFKSYINTGREFGIGVTNPQTELHVSGTISASKFIGDGSQLTNISFTDTQNNISVRVLSNVEQIIPNNNDLKVSGSITPTSGSGLVPFNLGSVSRAWNNVLATNIGDESPIENIFVGNFVIQDSKIRHKDNDGSISIAGIGSTKVGVGTTTPTERLDVDGNFKVSGKISGSGDLLIGTGSGTSTINFHNLPTTSSAVQTGQLYTQSGSQLPFSGSTAELNAIATQKFVLIK